MTPTAIKYLQSSREWRAFENHVRGVMRSLDSLDGIDFTHADEAAIEARGRQVAIQKLSEVLEPFVTLEEGDDTARSKVEKDAGIS